MRSARVAPCTIPVGRSTPVGPSMATMGISRSSDALEQRGHRRRGARPALRCRAGRPPPARPWARGRRALPRGHPPPAPARAIRSRSSAPCARGAVTQTGTSSRCSARASTQPSPPLLPGPGGDQHAVAQAVRVALGEHGRDGAAGGLHQGGELDAAAAAARPRRRIVRGRERGSWGTELDVSGPVTAARWTAHRAYL